MIYLQVLEWYHQGGCGGGFYEMKVDLLGEDGQVFDLYIIMPPF
jgi:hypothetical protein